MPACCLPDLHRRICQTAREGDLPKRSSLTIGLQRRKTENKEGKRGEGPEAGE